MKEITVYNLGKLPTAELDSFNELQEDFKISEADNAPIIFTKNRKYIKIPSD